MKRNLDLIRDLLLAIEASPENHLAQTLAARGYTEEETGFHVYLLGDAGYAQVIEVTTADSALPQALPANLTWKGEAAWLCAHRPGHVVVDICRSSDSSQAPTYIRAKQVRGTLIPL